MPELMPLDGRLPKADGLQVLKRGKENADLRLLPVAILTTSDAGRDLQGQSPGTPHQVLLFASMLDCSIQYRRLLILFINTLFRRACRAK